MPARRTPTPGGERGFTLPEVLIVIVLLGILAAIAIPSWFGFIDGRNAVSAANQVTADLRLAHTTARNRLEKVDFTLGPAPNCYSVVGSGINRSRCLPDGARFGSTVGMSFRSSGDVRRLDGTTFTSAPEIVVTDSRGGTPHTIRVNTQTSRVEVV